MVCDQYFEVGAFSFDKPNCNLYRQFYSPFDNNSIIIKTQIGFYIVFSSMGIYFS